MRLIRAYNNRFIFSIKIIFDMVEGPTAKAYSIKISREFNGEIVKNVLVKSRKTFLDPKELLNKRFLGSDSIGKNILLSFEDFAVRVHLMMFGTIHIYEANENLQKPIERVRLLIEGSKRKLIVYNAPIIEIDKKEALIERLKSALGPDLLSSEWDKGKAINNILKHGKEKIGVILLDQSVIAGIGNILRNEILFRARISPERRVENMSEDEVKRVVEACKVLSEDFLKLKVEGKGIKQILKVYNRYRGRCDYCGGPIRFYMQKPINRKTFVCENCQM